MLNRTKTFPTFQLLPAAGGDSHVVKECMVIGEVQQAPRGDENAQGLAEKGQCGGKA